MTTLVVAHDAGGAEILSSWALRQKEELRFILSGPALQIFERKVPQVRRKIRASKRVVFVLCGSSANATLERNITQLAIDAEIPCAVWLDHWKHYALRFQAREASDHSSSDTQTTGVRGLPSEIWVTDRWAAKLVLEELIGYPEDKVRIKGNPYMEDVVREIRTLRYRSDLANRLDPHAPVVDLVKKVLYVHEPGREKEFQRWAGKRFGKNQLLRERPHPSMGEAERTLAEDIAWADVVVGCDSMAMAIALRAGREVYSVLPKEEQLTIPFPGIKRG